MKYESTNSWCMFVDSIPQVMQALQWGGIVLMIIGAVLIFVGRKIENKEKAV